MLRKAAMSRLHRTQPGQESMIDASAYLCWPRIHREIIDQCQNCRWCSLYGKNVKSAKPFNSSKQLPTLMGPNEELRLGFGGPMLDKERKKIYILAAPQTSFTIDN